MYVAHNALTQLNERDMELKRASGVMFCVLGLCTVRTRRTWKQKTLFSQNQRSKTVYTLRIRRVIKTLEKRGMVGLNDEKCDVHYCTINK
jgi:hypothetical protein